MTNDCARLDRWMTAYLDDELDAVHALEVEDHAMACEPCRERVALDRAVRASLRATKPTASDALRRRAAAALVMERSLTESEGARPMESEGARLMESEGARLMESEGARLMERELARAAEEAPASQDAPASQEVLAAPGTTTPRLVRLRYAMPFAIAASVALVAGGAYVRDAQRPSHAATNHAEPESATAQMTNSFDRFIDDLVETHMQPPPPEVTDDDGLTRLNPFVGVRVHRPELTALGARYLGARMHHRQAAMLQYAVGDRRRVTLYVFDPARLPVQANRLKPRVVENKHLYLGHVRGYAVAASERDGVGYALASDLSDQETEKVIVMAAR
ncbi:MAG: zf-HC2 domain-containing protein [Deltaproteobacteria bacterium]|nr:zf-HC2 domain-containing protein [Deltaproteobacteria bacterium]